MKLKIAVCVEPSVEESQTIKAMDRIANDYCNNTNCKQCPLSNIETGENDGCFKDYWDKLVLMADM